MIQFKYKSIPDAQKSQQLGRTFYRQVEYFEISWRNDIGRTETRDGEVTKEKLLEWRTSKNANGMPDEQRRAYAKAYDEWREANADMIDGTPLATLPFLSPADIDNLQACGIKTLEQLVIAPDDEFWPELKRLQTHAKDYLSAAEGPGKSAAVIQDLRAKIVALEAEIAELKASKGMATAAPISDNPRSKARARTQEAA